MAPHPSPSEDSQVHWVDDDYVEEDPECLEAVSLAGEPSKEKASNQENQMDVEVRPIRPTFQGNASVVQIPLGEVSQVGQVGVLKVRHVEEKS